MPNSWMSCLAPLQTPLQNPTRTSSRPAAAPASAPDMWLRTPTGWSSVPEGYQLPASSQYGLPQRPTPSSAGLRGPLIPSVSPPGRLPVRPPLSPLPPSATVLHVPSHARILAGPLTQTPSPPRSQCTSLKTKSTPLSDWKNGKGLPPGLGSTPAESRPTPHSSLESSYNTVSWPPPGSVYGLRVVF